MNTPTIEREDNDTRGQYTYQRDGEEPAILTFERQGSILLLDKTLVPSSYRGQGVALELVKHSVADARENGWTLQPACSYVVAQFAKHPEWADVLAS